MFERMTKQTLAHGDHSVGFWLACLSIFALCGACTPCRESCVERESQIVYPQRSVVAFLVDGMALHRVEEMLAAGELPNIQRVFVDGGVRVRNAVTSLPSITYCNCTSVITGVYPGHHGIMGNFWFDPESLQTHYYMTYGTYRMSNQDFTAPTLFEILDDKFTVSIQAHTRRGADEIIDNHTMFGLCWGMAKTFHSGHYYTFADRCIGDRFADVPSLAKKHGEWPSVVWTYYPGTDDTAHTFGSNSKSYGKALRDIDQTVGLVARKLEELCLRDSTYLVLVTDHSHVPIGDCHAISIPKWLCDNRGMKVLVNTLEQHKYVDRFAKMSKYDAVGGLDGDRVVRLYLRGKSGWGERATPQEIDAFVHNEPPLVSIPGVGWVLTKDGTDAVHVFASEGECRVERRAGNDGLEYRLVNIQGDPMRYTKSPELAAYVQAGWHGSREWLAHTTHADCPDFPSQAVEIFDSTHTGDIVLFAASDWSFDTKQRGGHGSCLASDMEIPLYFAGADLPRGAEIGPGRIVDVTPTIVGLLGEGERLKNYKLDGIDLSGQLKHASTRPAQ
jgi:Type I phosphodiesterase / nucleotide pyrophosphatase